MTQPVATGKTRRSMRFRDISIVTFSLLVIGVSASTAEISELVRSGKLYEARSALKALDRDSAKSGNMLYFKALVETDGRRSASLLEDALRNSPDKKYRDDITVRLAQYYVVKGEYQSASKVVGDSKASYDASRLNALSLEKTGDAGSSGKQLDKLAKTSVTPSQQKWLAIDQARLALAGGKKKTAISNLQALVGTKNKEIVPQALYLLCAQAIDAGKIDEAARWYNLLNDQFPGAVGLDGLVDKLGSVSSQPETDTKAESATGTFYSVKVGVFSSAENATQQAEKFKSSRQKVESSRKSIGGKQYTIVYVGRFKSFDEADRARQDLEAQTGEQYQVVAR